MELDITTTRDDNRAVVVLRGSVDLANRDEVVAAARAALGDGSPAGLVIDLAAVSFMDSTGIGALVTLAHDSEDAGVTFSLRAPSPRVTRTLEISGLLNVWPTEQVT
jgi:anti-sigma B factor antagonist